MDLRTPLEIALGEYMGRFYASLVADTPAMTEYIARGLKNAIVWVPGRMIDQVELMVVEWRKNDNTGKPGLSSTLPVTFVAMAKDFTPVLPEYSIAIGTPIDVSFPDDPLQRAYKARSSANEYRAQVVFAAPEVHTAHSLAMQFNLWANGYDGGRHFKARYPFAGIDHEFPAVLEAVDMGAVNTPTGQDKNLTILVADLTIRATVPLFQGPFDVIREVNTDATTGAQSKTSLDADGHIVLETHER
jgi:hypothetical protein